MRCLAIDLLEEPDEMKLGEKCLVGNAFEVDALAKVFIDEELALDNSPVQVDFRIEFFGHGSLRIVYVAPASAKRIPLKGLRSNR